MEKNQGKIKRVLKNYSFSVRLDHTVKHCKIKYACKTATEMHYIFQYQNDDSVWSEVKEMLRKAEEDVTVFKDKNGIFYGTEREYIDEALRKVNEELSGIKSKTGAEPQREEKAEEKPGENRPFTVYTDGGCDANPGGTGGYGVVVIDNDTGEITEFSGWEPNSTNNRMEITATAVGMKNVPEGASVVLYSDSQYEIFTMQGKYKQGKNIPY